MIAAELVEFLRACLDEDEAAILDGWDSDGKARVASMWTGGTPGYTTVASDDGPDTPWIADGREVTDARHVHVLFDPAHALAQVAEHRRIVEHEERLALGDVSAAVYGPRNSPILRALATIYADRPGYREEWRP